jgi:hypothetical protein
LIAKREYFHLTIKHTYYDWFDNQCPRDKKHPDVQAKEIGAAAYWLNDERRAVVFYGEDTVEKIRGAKGPLQAKHFIDIGDEESRRESTLIATVQNGFVWIYRCTGIAEDGGQLTIGGKGEDKPDLSKSFPIQLFDGFPKKISDMPPVLAGTKANTYIAQSTFRKLPSGSMLGNIAAIQAATGSWEDNFKVDPLDCLASVELETLVAKLFEAHGCFVPAARGGVLPGVDLFVTPVDGVKLGRLSLQGTLGNNRSTYSIQIKKKAKVNGALSDWLQRDDKHVLITLNDTDEQSKRHFGKEWLREAINQTPAVSQWLMESLKWLPLQRQDPPLVQMRHKGSHADPDPIGQAAERPGIKSTARLHLPDDQPPAKALDVIGADTVRERLVAIALEWQSLYGIAPAITSTISEFDAAKLVGMPIAEYSKFMSKQGAVAKGLDFIWEGIRYQVKANRPGGRPGSHVTLVPKAKNYDWDKLIWILYNTRYEILEAWMWEREAYRAAFDARKRLSPKDYRQGSQPWSK